MLSNTKGYSRYSRALGYHRDDLSKLSRVCPALRKRGKCKAHVKEQELRRTIAAAKEAELLSRATQLYNMQMDLAADVGATGGDGEEEALLQSMAAQQAFSTDPQKKEEVLRKLVEELKQEPAYLNWSLDAAVAERMVELRIKPCLFTHREELTLTLKRSRNAQDKADAKLHQQQRREITDVLRSDNVERDSEKEIAAAVEGTSNTKATKPVNPAELTRSPPDARVRADLEQWAEERQRVFLSLTPLQRCVVCLLWQRTYRIEQGVVFDVRLLLEKRLTDLYDRTGVAVVDGQVVAAQPTHTPATANSEEDPLDAYLSSSAFEELVERESKRTVTCVAFRPEFGLVDLSALPLLVAYLSTTPGCGVLLARTLAYFSGKALPPLRGHAATQRVIGTVDLADDRPAPVSFHHLLFPQRRPVTEKEVDLGGTARANELVEALEWMLQVYQREAQLQQQAKKMGWRTASPVPSSSSPQDSGAPSAAMSSHPQHTMALFRHQRIRLHGLTLTRCKLTSADAFVAALHKRSLESYLYALDLSENRLWSLRFLLILRTHFAQRLLRLSLKNNPITRKPEYQEQVRTSLPQLTSLDGEPIRRSPLRMPKPLPGSYTRWPQDGEGTAEAEQATVLDCVGRLLYIWETRRIPRTQRELEAAAEAAETAEGGEEEELNEDNFPHRYLHPGAAFSVTLAPGMSFFEPSQMRDARAVEFEDAYEGMRLSAVDVRDARVFDVAMKNSSRNLLAGRPALQRFGKGADNCYLAYQLTVYPERMEVEHHLTDAVLSVVRLEEVAAAISPTERMKKPSASLEGSKKTGGKREKKQAKEEAAKQQQQQAHFGTLAQGKAPTRYVVTLHGVMTWRLPSMKNQECMQASYTRVMVLTKKVLPVQNREWERLRSPPYVLMNDQLFLCPAPNASATAELRAWQSSSAIFQANTPARLSRLVVEFGLEACRDGIALVRDVLERCTSPASEHAALQALVLGLLGPLDGEVSDPTKSVPAMASVKNDVGSERNTLHAAAEAATLACAREAEVQLSGVFDAFMKQPGPVAAVGKRTYFIFSVLGGVPADSFADVVAASGVSKHADTKALPSSLAAASTGHQPAKKPQKEEQKRNRKDVAASSASPATTTQGPAASSLSPALAPKTAVQQWAAAAHVVSLALVHKVTAITNQCYTSL